jgi:hypothetical protein
LEDALFRGVGGGGEGEGAADEGGEFGIDREGALGGLSEVGGGEGYVERAGGVLVRLRRWRYGVCVQGAGEVVLLPVFLALHAELWNALEDTSPLLP